MENMDKTFILPNYVEDEMVSGLKKTSFHLLKENLLDSCENIKDIDDIGGIETIEMLIASMPEKVSLDDFESLYTVFEQYCELLDKDDPQKTIFKKRFNDIVENLEEIQFAIYSLALKAKIAEGYDYARVYASSDILDVKDQISKFQNEIRDYESLLHVVMEGACSGSTGPDEIERALSSLYAQFEQIAEHGEEIKEEYFS